jgi:hypothetical protein
MAGDFELPDPEMLAYQLSEAVVDQEGDEKAQEYLARFAEELLTLEPGLSEWVTGRVLEELCEEVGRREDPKYAHATTPTRPLRS